MFEFWQFYVGGAMLVGLYVWITSANEGSSEPRAFLDGFLATLLAPLILVMLTVSYLAKRRKSC